MELTEKPSEAEFGPAEYSFTRVSKVNSTPPVLPAAVAFIKPLPLNWKQNPVKNQCVTMKEHMDGDRDTVKTKIYQYSM